MASVLSYAAFPIRRLPGLLYGRHPTLVPGQVAGTGLRVPGRMMVCRSATAASIYPQFSPAMAH